jgi:hypothetical protein
MYYSDFVIEKLDKLDQQVARSAYEYVPLDKKHVRPKCDQAGFWNDIHISKLEGHEEVVL